MNVISQSSRKCGVALVLVLGFLVIITALAIAFFSSVTTELRASRNFQGNVNTRQLQEAVVNLVEGQIRQATAVSSTDSSTLNVAWASQPGMISTFGDGNGKAASTPLANYKLYSSAVMTLKAGTTNLPLTGSNVGTAPGTSTPPPAPTGDLVSNWNTMPAVWTDLNAPVLVQDPSQPTVPNATVPRFPIIDPRAAAPVNATSNPPAYGAGASTSANPTLVEGFSYVTPSGDPITNFNSTNLNNSRLAMPVQWIYILKDGTLVTPDANQGSGVQATFKNSASLTSANPIVGRVAFWTDDDTSKLNINTAGGSYWTSTPSVNGAENGYSASQYAGSFWDTPRVVSLFDEGQVYAPGVTSPAYISTSSGNGGSPLPPVGALGATYPGGGGLAAVQMVQNEFQRYPGHPAQTSLAMVFRNILTPEQMYMVTPRLVANNQIVGGTTAATTQGGSFRLHIPPPVGAAVVPGAATYGTIPNAALPIRYDRLYDSVDELLYAFNSTATAGSSSYTRMNNIQVPLMGVSYAGSFPGAGYNSGNVSDVTKFTPGLLDQLRFFLTAYNRAPELNLFGHPRVCVWPVRSQSYTEDTTAGTPGNGSGGAPSSTQTSTGINAYDSLSLFCSTIGPSVIPSVPTALNSALASQTQPPSASSPPFHYSFFRREITGTTAPTQSTVPPTDIYLPRNQQLMTFLQQQVIQAIPGFGQAFSPTKYAQADINETLVEMFDYIRCANLYDSTQIIQGAQNNPSYYNPHPFAPTGIVMPSVCKYLPGGLTQNGMGRFPTICEASIVFYYAGSDKTTPAIATTPTTSPNTTANLYTPRPILNTTGSPGAPTAATQEYLENSGVLVIIPPNTAYAPSSGKASQIPTKRYVRAAMIFSTFNPMQGYGPITDPTYTPNGPPTTPLVTLQVSGLNNFTVGSGSETFVSGVPFPTATPTATSYAPPGAPGTISLGATSGDFWGGRNFGGFEGLAHTLYNASVADGLGKPLQGPYPAGLMTPFNAPMVFTVGTLAYQAGPGGIAPVAPANTPNTVGDYEEAATPTFQLKCGGPIQVCVYYGGTQIQTINIQFPGGPVTLPLPRGDDIIDAEPFKVTPSAASPPVLTPTLLGGFPILANSSTTAPVVPPMDANPATSTQVGGGTQGGPQSYGQLRRWYWSQDTGSFDPNVGRTTPARPVAPSTAAQNFLNKGAVYGRTVGAARDFQLRINWALSGNGTIGGAGSVNDSGGIGSSSDSPFYLGTPPVLTNWLGGRWRQIVQPGDTVRSMIFCNLPPPSQAQPTAPTTASGDLRLASVTNVIPAISPPSAATGPGFYPHPDYGITTTAATGTSTMQQACLLRGADGNLYYNYPADNFFKNAVNAASGLGPVGYTGLAGPAQNIPWFSNQLTFGNHVALTSTKGFTKASFPNGALFPSAFAVADLPRALGPNSVYTPAVATPYSVNGVIRGHDLGYGDFDTGVGSYADGPYFNKQDEGNATFSYYDEYTGQLYYPIPYFGSGSYSAPGSAFNSPNRQMPSAVMMGSLLSQAASGYGWQTLCFCPNPAGNATPTTPNGTPAYPPSYPHIGLTAPNDELLLDLFQMPVVQPYPISEPFSTAGKVNLNYQIQPFNYILRSTALRAVLESERVSMIGTAVATSLTPTTSGGAPVSTNPATLMFQQYKAQPTTTNQPGLPQEMMNNIRYVIDRDQTVNEIGAYIAKNGVFRSAAQICEIYLVPFGASWNVAASPTVSFTTAAQSAQTQWNNAGLASSTGGDLTGDNMREKPYADIYPRLTTKSNTYTIHMRVQALQQISRPTSSGYQTWDESKDAVLGEYRGSATIERYIDPSNAAFAGAGSGSSVVNADAYAGGSTWVNPDLTTADNSLEALYRFRTVNTKKFSP
jgi:uncharacterized protein (TIGR02600 family)